MRELRVLAVDDEPLALQRIEWTLAGMAEVELVGQAQSGHRALELVQSLQPDVLLLDIDMPPPNGLDVVEALPSGLPLEVVFVTAFDEYAVRAFELSATDYLLKPVDPGRLAQALERARARLAHRSLEARVDELKAVIAQLRRARQDAADSRYDTELWIVEGDARVRIPVEKVDRIQAWGDYVRLFFGGRERLMRARVSDLEGRLDPRQFVRIHRSQIVRRELILALRRTPTGRTRVVLADGSEHPVSRRHVAAVKDRLRS